MFSKSSIIHLKDLVGVTDAQIYLIVGPPGAGKETFALQYIIDGFAEKNNGVIVTTDDFPNDIISKIKQLGTDATSFLSSKQLEFVDVFSYKTGEKSEGAHGVESAKDLTNLSVIIKKQIDTKSKLRLLINTVSTLSIFNTGVALLDFIQTQIARLKQKNHSGLIIAHQGMMDEKVIQGVKAFVDGVIEFQTKEDESGTIQRRLRIVYAPQIKKSGWVNLFQ